MLPNWVNDSVRTFMAQDKVPGFAAAIVKNKKMVWSQAYGVAEIQNNKPMSLDGILNIGSVSKTITATAAMQLWEKGLLSLDADINTYLNFKVKNPKFPDKPITIFQILTHTSSLRDGKAYGDSYVCGNSALSLNDWIFAVLTTDGKYYYNGDSYGDWPSGEKHMYSNVAFGLLGLIVEKVAKQPFNEYCRDNIFKPLGMKNTGWLLSEIDTTKYINTYAYVTEENRKDFMTMRQIFPRDSIFKAGTLVQTCLYSFPNYPDGLVRTSVRELSYYLAAMLNGGKLRGKRILKAETINKMLSLQLKNNQSQGLTWRTADFETKSGKVKLWGHSGYDPGIATYLFFDRTTQTGVITFQNNAGDHTQGIVGLIYGAAMSVF